MNYALVATCITSLKPFLKPFHTGGIVNTVGGGASGLLSGSHAAAQGIYMLTSLSNDKKVTAATTTTMVDDPEDEDCTVMTPRGKLYTGENSAKVTTAVSGPKKGEEKVEMSRDRDSGQMVIERTMEWDVRYDSRERLT